MSEPNFVHKGIAARSDNWQELFAGGLIATLGAVVFVVALAYPLGTAARMGPGFFPLLLGALLFFMGIGIAVLDARRNVPEDGGFVAFVRPRLRAVLYLIAAPVAFALLIEPTGLIPAVCAAVFISTFADRSAPFLRALILAVSVALLCALIFGVGLGLSIDLIG